MLKGIEIKINEEGYPNADEVMRGGVLLPVHHGMTNEMFQRLHDTVDDFINLHA